MDIIEAREKILTKKNQIVFRTLSQIENLNLHPEDMATIREIIRIAFLSYTNFIFKLIGFERALPWRK